MTKQYTCFKGDKYFYLLEIHSLIRWIGTEFKGIVEWSLIGCLVQFPK